MWSAILWPSLLALFYLMLFGLVLFLGRRFTRGFEAPEPMAEEPAAPLSSARAPQPVDATPGQPA